MMHNVFEINPPVLQRGRLILLSRSSDLLYDCVISCLLICQQVFGLFPAWAIVTRVAIQTFMYKFVCGYVLFLIYRKVFGPYGKVYFVPSNKLP